MSEIIQRRKSGHPLKLVIDIRSNQDKKTKIKTMQNRTKIEYAPGVLKFITMLVEDMARQDLARKEN